MFDSVSKNRDDLIVIIEKDPLLSWSSFEDQILEEANIDSPEFKALLRYKGKNKIINRLKFKKIKLHNTYHSLQNLDRNRRKHLQKCPKHR